MSCKDRYLTAGVAALLVSGNNLVPAPPPSMTEATFFGFARRLSKRGASTVYTDPTNIHNQRLMEPIYCRFNQTQYFQHEPKYIVKN